jgi:hypothetical protein
MAGLLIRFSKNLLAEPKKLFTIVKFISAPPA